jgi:CheY-like chemotaxis protein
VAKTLLAVDDSTTMRKVLEITFSGEDFQVLTAGNRDAAMGQVGGNPNAVVIDTVLDGDDGYALCKEIRGRLPRAAIVLLSSRYHPYDQGKGRDAGADDYMDKPFDTQQLIEKVKKLLVAKEAAGPAATVSVEHAAPTPYRSPAQPVAAPPPPAPPPPQRIEPPRAPPMAAAPPRPVTPPSPPVAAQAKPRAATLMFPGTVEAPPAPPPPQPRVEPPPPVRVPEPPTAAPPAPPIAAAVNGQMASKLGEMGLTPAQAEAVMALSKEVVERVVWEVVPQLAEILIKEEIARLTKE